MIHSSFLKKFLIALSIAAFASCDSDFNEIGADIINGDIHYDIDSVEVAIAAYDNPMGALINSGVQGNNLEVNTLGVYDNPVFGKTLAHFVTQVRLDTEAPEFTTNVVLDSVYLYVPFHSKVETVEADGSRTYSVDSVYGNPAGKFRLQVLRNGYYLRNLGADGQPQKYYTNDKALIDAEAGPSLLADGQTDVQVGFSSAEVVREAYPAGSDTKKIAERLAPGFFLYLDKTFFQEQILNASASSLLNNNVFKNYFRGIYFRVQQEGNDVVMGVPNFAAGKITLIYHQDKTNTDGTVTQESKTMTLSLQESANRSNQAINLFENTYTDAFGTAVASTDQGGDTNLYVKGGQGSVAFIDIDQASLNALKPGNNGGNKLLVNEANLIFYVNHEAMGNAELPKRLYLYDVNNKRPLYDYFVDITTNASDRKYNKFVHGGILQYVNGQAQYKVRITDHVNNLISRDSTNVRLGLAVTESIAITSSAAVREPIAGEVNEVPAAAVMNPSGVVLYGNGPAAPADKRLKLQIYYTKPKE